ncbi:hypothetical protein AA0472_2328 [Acetobacter estunensis NRIC 0472]|nr:hypothetical protein AA0472_2328 [Acetobacter estunensis NRIC 0472]
MRVILKLVRTFAPDRPARRKGWLLPVLAGFAVCARDAVPPLRGALAFPRPTRSR